MKIEKINLSESETSKFGLKAVRMERLNNIVLIAGKNGAGKSRLLQLIREQVKKILNKAAFEESLRNIETFKKAKKSL
jgi:ABC-type Mn2+/Zn2+ transport system ATPase subunit